MRKLSLTILLLFAVLAAGLAVWQRPSNAQQAAARPDVYEYKVVPAKEFGMHVSRNGSVFDYDGAAEKLNELAEDGWQYRDTLSAGDLTAVLLERKR